MLLTFGLQTGSSWGIMAWFVANQEAIAEQACVNKSRPLLHCNGKCVLAEKLHLAEQADAPVATVHVPPLFPLFDTRPDAVFVPIQTCEPRFADPEPSASLHHSGRIFHPPPRT